MSATPKPVRKLAKLLEKSNRKETAIVLKKAPKQIKKKHAQETGKMIKENYKHDISRKEQRMAAHKHMKEHAK